MDPNSQNPNLSTRPMNEPHIPISDSEIDPTPKANSSTRNTLLTLSALLILVSVIGITLWFYLQNRLPKMAQQTPTLDRQGDTPSLSEETKNVKEISGFKVEGAQNQALVEKYGVICRMFKSIEEAIETPEIACIVDLTGQNINSLPESVNQLNKLEHVLLPNNNFTVIPQALTNHPNVLYIDLSDNNISEVGKLFIAKDKITGNPRKITINLKRNPLNEAETSKAKANNPSVTFEF